MITAADAKELLEAFERAGVEYVLVGSMAMAIQGLVRATHDIDFFVAPTTENIARLRRALTDLFHDPTVEEITAEDLIWRVPAIEYIPPTAGYTMDILARLGEASRYEDLEWHEMEWKGVRVRVATPKMLYRNKRDTVRGQDRVDAEWIRQEFRLAED